MFAVAAEQYLPVVDLVEDAAERRAVVALLRRAAAQAGPSAIVVPKSAFPTKRVYAQTPGPTLRLVTCSGALDPSTGQHPDNRIVFASLIRVA